MVTLIRDSSDIFQLCASPLTKPEMMTNRSTSTLMEVKTLLTQADSFTPNDRSPKMRRRATELRAALQKQQDQAHGKEVRVLSQAGRVHAEVGLTEHLDVPSDHVIKGATPSPGDRGEVGGAGFGDAGAELGVAQAGHDGGQRRDQEGDDDAGARVSLGHLAGQDVDAGAQGAADPQGDEVGGPQAAAQLGVLQAAHVDHLPAHQGAAERQDLLQHVDAC
ncbi:hypothetical protein EYF80_037964 [Liparis tanakae]|uniref:Uncharacterized protein n=1 Tax=Liparis tanakae TaxID=230148 RepID=A0A4Z2GE99_9TELE|nr:hypothetical protein EYF80_037964 [Liparis tanakae]